jgi:hypothetical protein
MVAVTPQHARLFITDAVAQQSTRPDFNARLVACSANDVLAYNLTRVMNIMGIQPLMAAIRA